jgi:uncharacterized membrane protein
MGIMIVLLAIPLMLRWVPRNRVYGFRTPYALSSDEVWYRANTIMGSALFLAGLFLIAVDLVVPIMMASRQEASRVTIWLGVGAVSAACGWTAWRVYRHGDGRHRSA